MLRQPLVAVLVLAPVLGEWLTTATPPLDMLLWPPALVLLVALYGGGALLCRELARRSNLGLLGLCLIAAAYAVFEEAVVDRYWFQPRALSEGGLGTYSEVWHINVLLATNLTVFHVAVSIVSTIVLVELAFPTHRQRPWVEGRGLIATVAAFLVLPPLLYGEYTLDPMPQLALAALLVVALVLIGRSQRREPSLWSSTAATEPARPGLAPVAFTVAAANSLLMGLAETEVPWPLALVAVLAPVVLGGLFVASRASGPVFGRDGLRVVTGIVGYYCVLSGVIGLAGRFDLTLGALAVVWLLWALRGRVRETEVVP